MTSLFGELKCSPKCAKVDCKGFVVEGHNPVLCGRGEGNMSPVVLAYRCSVYFCSTHYIVLHISNCLLLFPKLVN